jgi:hypothetical protein
LDPVLQTGFFEHLPESVGFRIFRIRGWGLVTPIWGPMSLNLLGDSYGELDFRRKRGFCGTKIEGWGKGLRVEIPGGSTAL